MKLFRKSRHHQLRKVKSNQVVEVVEVETVEELFNKDVITTVFAKPDKEKNVIKMILD